MNDNNAIDLPRVILVTRQTRFKELLHRHQTESQARFYLESLGADFDDYLLEDKRYQKSQQKCLAALQNWGRYQVLDRRFLSNFIFAADDIVVVLGQDGTVANCLKYLHGQPVIGVNPEVSRWDGLLLPFVADDLGGLLPEVQRQSRQLREVTMAEARLSDGQTLLAVNDFFLGCKTHTSAFYEIQYRQQTERQSSSGLVVSTGLGSTAWLNSIVRGSQALLDQLLRDPQDDQNNQPGDAQKLLENDLTKQTRLNWDSDRLLFAVREPFVTRKTGASVVFGEISGKQTLKVRSLMPDNGVLFSDGMEHDYLSVAAGVEVAIGVSAQRGFLVH